MTSSPTETDRARSRSTSFATDLSWTGNLFLAEDRIRQLVFEESTKTRFTCKGSKDARPLREELGRTYGVDPAWIAVGAGSSQILEGLFRWFQDHEIVDVIPNFHMAHLVSRRSGLAYRPVPVRHGSELLPALADARSSRPQILVLSSPRNPLSYSFPMESLVDLLDTWSGPVVLDEAYVEFSACPSRFLPFVERYPRLILVRTFSKAWGLANLRVGYTISQLIRPAFRDDYLLPYNVGELAQRVACRLLQDPSPVQESVALTLAARERLLASLREIRGLHVWPSDANFLCVESPLARDIAARLHEAGVKVALLQALRHFPQDWPHGLRISAAPLRVCQLLVSVFQSVLGRLESPLPA